MKITAAVIALLAPLGLAVPAGARIAATQELVTLHAKARLFYGPDIHAPRRRAVAARRPLTLQQTVLPVLEERSSPDGRRWLRVLLPGRPNGHAGWIQRRAVSIWRSPWRVVVDTTRRRVSVLRKGRLVRVFAAVVGRPSAPTPRGRFFVEEAIILRPRSPGAPYAFALSARSNVYQEFDGGPGQVAIHGIYGIGGTPGTAVSHGCIRMNSAALRWMITRFGTGTPVTIQ
jgi:lipoprotein-anchoring transpeptidase ErfK/SrfK